MYNGDKVREAFSRFDVLERRVDEAQGYADALKIGTDAPKTLGDEIAALESFDVVDAELEEMKKAMQAQEKKG
jgi:phage shock protein A